MSLFGSLMADVEDDPFFGSHMRSMHQMNSIMNSMFSNPFLMLSGGPMGPLALRDSSSLMPFAPQMPSLNRLFSDSDGNHMGTGSSFSSSTVVMSSGPNGKPQVYSSSSSMKIGPNGVKETLKTLQDSRTGTKKMSIGHHIGERAHVLEREQNVYTGDREERQEFINIDEEEAEDFDREYQTRAGAANQGRSRAALPSTSRREPSRLALPAPPSPNTNREVGESRRSRPSSRRPIRAVSSPLAMSSSTNVRELYGGSHPQRTHHRHKSHKPSHRYYPSNN